MPSPQEREEAVKLWTTDSWDELLRLRGKGSLFNLITLAPDGQRFLAVTGEGDLHLWAAPSFDEIAAAGAEEKADGEQP